MSFDRLKLTVDSTCISDENSEVNSGVSCMCKHFL